MTEDRGGILGLAVVLARAPANILSPDSFTSFSRSLSAERSLVTTVISPSGEPASRRFDGREKMAETLTVVRFLRFVLAYRSSTSSSRACRSGRTSPTWATWCPNRERRALSEAPPAPALAAPCALPPPAKPAGTRPPVHTRQALMALLFCATTPVGTFIGVAVSESYEPESVRSQWIRGACNGITGGMLLYMTLISFIGCARPSSRQGNNPGGASFRASFLGFRGFPTTEGTMAYAGACPSTRRSQGPLQQFALEQGGPARAQVRDVRAAAGRGGADGAARSVGVSSGQGERQLVDQKVLGATEVSCGGRGRTCTWASTLQRSALSLVATTASVALRGCGAATRIFGGFSFPNSSRVLDSCLAAQCDPHL